MRVSRNKIELDGSWQIGFGLSNLTYLINGICSDQSILILQPDTNLTWHQSIDKSNSNTTCHNFFGSSWSLDTPVESAFFM